jgi:hypothetical protein
MALDCRGKKLFQENSLTCALCSRIFVGLITHLEIAIPSSVKSTNVSDAIDFKLSHDRFNTAPDDAPEHVISLCRAVIFYWSLISLEYRPQALPPLMPRDCQQH